MACLPSFFGKVLCEMEFLPVDLDSWPRREYFDHYFSAVPCTYSMTVQVDVTRLKERGLRFYPAMLYFLTRLVNRHCEFRTALNDEGTVGVFDRMLPSYTIFHPDTQTFSSIWTEDAPTLDGFCANYERDLDDYGDVHRLIAKPNPPENCFSVSMLPWSSFEGFNLNLQKGYTYLLPIFTLGRCHTQDGRLWMPVAIQVHHAMCDGFHVCRFLRELQEELDAC